MQWEVAIDVKGSLWNHKCQLITWIVKVLHGTIDANKEPFLLRGKDVATITFFSILENSLQFLEETKQNIMQFLNENPTSACFPTSTNPQIRNSYLVIVTSHDSYSRVKLMNIVIHHPLFTSTRSQYIGVLVKCTKWEFVCQIRSWFHPLNSCVTCTIARHAIYFFGSRWC